MSDNLSQKARLEYIIDEIPTYVERVADKLISEGYKAYLVGGSVRDLLLKKQPKDFDIATNAKPSLVEEIFPKSIATGARFGTIMVIVEDEKGERFDVEVTTFRNESNYLAGRWPSKVTFSNSIKEDLSRRDFTINAIAIDLEDTVDKSLRLEDILVDPYNGLNDIDNKLIKCVGEPKKRFSEDGLRAIRACRFSSVLDFKIQKETFDAISKTLYITKMVAIERVKDELDKILYDSKKPSKGLRLLEKSGILSLYIPELVDAKKFDQPEYHADNVFEHSLKTMDIAEDDIKWAALLHDIGKIKTRTVDKQGVHYYGHDTVGAEMAESIYKRLKFPKREIMKYKNLIRWHMFFYPSAEWRKDKEITEIIKEKGKKSHGWSDAAVRRLIANVGGHDQMDDLIKLRIADATSNEKTHFDSKEIDALEKRIADLREKDMALKVEDLEVSGSDLKELGYEPGPIFSMILEFLLEQVLEDPSKNSKEDLKHLVKKHFPIN